MKLFFKKTGKDLDIGSNWKRRLLGLRSPTLQQHRFTVLSDKKDTQDNLLLKIPPLLLVFQLIVQYFLHENEQL